jgi:cytochrome b pre-mRNA-processing protein 3
MLGFLFRRLTAAPSGATALFDAITREARAPFWYAQGGVPDTIDGRFAMLSTLLALALVRLDQLGDEGMRFGVALTERFVTVMESEHRELGLGDPTLGKTVRKLVAALSHRVGLWRDAVENPASWEAATEQSLFRHSIAPTHTARPATQLELFWSRLTATALPALMIGDIA